MTFSLYQLLPATVVFLAFSNASAQIVPDTSLGKEASVIGTTQPNTGIQVISGGAVRGSSLFQSFEQFNIGAGQKVYFGTPPEISNILTRVTGNSASVISGTLGVLGNANLFFLNPKGIIFTNNARLDLSGSFLATTANSFTFPDSSTFSATTPQPAPLLTVNVPIGLNFSGSSGAIQVLDTPQVQTKLPFVGTFPTSVVIDGVPTGLRVSPGKTLGLVGGSVSFDSGIAAAPAGRIEVGAVDQGTVVIIPDLKGFTLDYGKAAAYNDIKLNRFSLLDASGYSGNQIRLQGKQISLSNGSFVAAGNTGGDQADSAITVNATEALNVTGLKPDPVFSLRYPEQAANAVIWSYALSGKGADIFISTPKLNLQTAGIILSTAIAPGTAGSISINAANSVKAAGFIPEVLRPGELPSKFSGIASIAYGSGSRTGDVAIRTKRLLLEDLGAVGTFSFEAAIAGNISVYASELVELKGADPVSGFGTRLVSTTSGKGIAGNLQIDTKQLQVLDGGTLGSSTISNGNAGDVVINASDLTRVAGKVPGTINRSRIVSSAQLQDPKLRAALGLPSILGAGNAKNLTIKTGQLLIDDWGEISVQNDGFGKAGFLDIKADSVNLANQSSISGSVGSDEGGYINMSVKDLLLLRDHSEISASATGNANGGSIGIDAALLVLDHSKISGSADQGKGGEVNIDVQGLFRSPDSTITATSARGAQFNGTVQINSPNLNLTRAVQQTSTSKSPEVSSVCQSRMGSAPSEFIIAGNGGIPPSPEDSLTSNSGWQGHNPSQAHQGLPQPQATVTPPKLIDAQGWKTNPDGTISFVANAEDADPDALFIPPSCQQVKTKTSEPPNKQSFSNSLHSNP